MPPSYTKFILDHGVFFISGDLTGRGDGNDSRLLTPSEAYEITLKYRKELAKSQDEESKKILNDGIIFCTDPDREFFYLFVISSAKTNGEMLTRSYDYQDPASSDPWHKGDSKFDDILKTIVNCVKENA